MTPEEQRHAALQALGVLSAIAHLNLHGNVEKSQFNCIEIIRAALSAPAVHAAPEAITSEQMTQEINSWAFDDGNPHQKFSDHLASRFPSGVRVIDKVK
jgi:hypothetical protein